MRRLCRWTAAILVAATTTGCGVTGDKAGGARAPAPTVLTLVHTVEPTDIRPFVAHVDRLSHGSIRIETRQLPRTVAGDDDARVLDDVDGGRAQLGATSAMLESLDIDSHTMQERVLHSDLANELTAPAGLDRIGILPGPLIRPAGGGRALLGPDTYRGTRIAIPPAGHGAGSLSTLGAAIVPHNLLGGSTFALDAIAAPIATIASSFYDGAVTTLTTNVVLGARPLIIFGRPTSAVKVLRAAADAAFSASIELHRTEENAGITALCQRSRIEFVSASETDLVALREVLGQDQRIAALRADAPPVDVPNCAAVVVAAATTLIDGVYEVTASDRSFRLTLARGRFEGGDRGSYAVHGDMLTMTPEPGPRLIAYRWTLYGDELTLYPVEGMSSPEVLRARPWRRIGDPPEADRTPIDGVYETLTGSGVIRWRLDRGQLDQFGNGESTWAHGSYVVTGDTITATYTRTGGEDVTSGAVKPGDTVSFRWNAYHGRLHLQPIGGANSPGIFCGVWRRIGDAS